MSDSFQSYVFGKALVDDGRADFRRVTAWLLAEEIIGSETADNVLGDGRGFVPGSQAASVIVEDAEYWRGLITNGVEISTGRIVEASADWEFGICPKCGARIEIDPDSEDCAPIYEALEAFEDSGRGALECPRCGAPTELENWDFGHGMAVGDALVRFWNWPSHKDDFAQRLSDVSGLKCRLVWGKL